MSLLDHDNHVEKHHHLPGVDQISFLRKEDGVFQRREHIREICTLEVPVEIWKVHTFYKKQKHVMLG